MPLRFHIGFSRHWIVSELLSSVQRLPGLHLSDTVPPSEKVFSHGCSSSVGAALPANKWFHPGDAAVSGCLVEPAHHPVSWGWYKVSFIMI